MIENSCEYYNSEVEGIILDYQIAKILGIENIDHLSIKMTVYIPVALKHDIGQITASDGMTYEIEFGNSIYTPVEMNLPVKGILSKAHINLSECFGYMDYQAMQKLFFDHAKQYHLQDDEYSWASNTYSIYVQKDNVEALYSELTECSNNYGLQSMQKSIADLMAPWTSLEKPFKIYTLCLASLAFILTIVYGFVKNKSEKREIALLNRWGISKTNLIKMILYEIVLSFITVACFSLVGLFIGFQIGLSQGWFIRGFDFSVAMKENYLISVVLSLSLVFLSYLSCLVSVQRKYYD